VTVRRFLLFALFAVAGYVAISVGYFAVTQREAYAITRIRGLEIDHLLGPADINEAGNFGEDFDVTANSHVILRFADRLYQAGATEPVAPLAIKGAIPHSIAIDSSDTLLAVAAGYFGVLNADGEVVQGVPLPYDDARLARSVESSAVYLFGGKERNYRLYRFLEQGRFQVLLESDVPIRAVTDTRSAIYLATDSYIARLDTPTPRLMFRAPNEAGWGRIVSLAASDDDLLFFSTEKRVYAWHRGVALSIINDSGGALRVRGDKLFVLDHKRQLLYAAHPASRALFPGAGP
jgi:hypothetical protein